MSIKRFVSALLTGALCLGVLTACGSAQKPASSGVSADAQRYSTIFYDAFDTVTQVIAYCDSEEEFSRQMDALHADLLEYHRLYDIYNDYAGVVNVKTINDNAGVAPVQVDDKILGMLELARQMYDTTNGKLNIAMGSVLRIWHDYREAAEANTNEADNKLPEQEALDAAHELGYPVLLRPSFVLGGRGMIIVYEEQELRRYMNEAVEASEERPVLIDRFLENAVEIDVDVIADRERAVIGAIMQHVEPAGIHSGDSASMIPAMGISMKMHKEITRASKELARRLNVCGLMNIQFAVKDEQLYVIEVNPRASRTVPFVSKAIGRPLAKLAAQVMAGKTLEELGFTREITPEYHCVKEAVFPWGRFPGIDVVLGPEMKSTGEVMGIDPDPDIAFAKSQISAFNPLPTEGKVFISVNDRDKERVLHMARQLADMGFTLCATRGTMIHLLQHDIECERAYKVNEARRPNIVDHIKNGDIDFIINTPGSHDARADDIIIRSSAIAAKTSYCTNLASAQACVNAIEALKNRNLQVCTIQEYHAQTV